MGIVSTQGGCSAEIVVEGLRFFAGIDRDINTQVRLVYANNATVKVYSTSSQKL